MEKKLSKKEWQEHVRGAEDHAEGIQGYCREHGLGNSSFHYWKKKLGKRLVAQFTPVEILPARASVRALPDAMWLAEFLRAYQGGGA